MGDEKKVKKQNAIDSLIVKTALITVCAIIGVFALILLITPLAAPSFAGGVCKTLGIKTAATHFYETAYERNANPDNFSNYIDAAYDSKDYSAVSGLVDDVIRFKNALPAGEYGTFATYVAESLYITGDKRGSAKFAVEVGGTALAYVNAAYSSDAEYKAFLDEFSGK